MGVIDERLDLALLDAVAEMRPGWEILLLGPTVKIDPATIPSRPNVHRLGKQPYQELPAWLGCWDVGLMPFARNESTRFISPTKTAEYLAAGLPVVSTPILDVVRTWGQTVRIAADASSFVDACEGALAERRSGSLQRRNRADVQLSTGSWDRTWAAMDAEVAALVGVMAS